MVDFANIFDTTLQFVMCRHFNDHRIVIMVCIQDGSHRVFRFPERIDFRQLLTRDGSFTSWEEIVDNMISPEGGWELPEDKLGYKEVLRSLAVSMVVDE